MSKYTIELRHAIESGFPIGLGDYPIFDENYRENLNNKIIDHYWFDEIGYETWDRFTHYLNSTMNEIMPYYNQLLKSELLKINPLLSFEKISNTNKDVDTSIVEDMTSNSSKTHDNTSSKDITNTTDQNINNSTSLQNKTNSKTDEFQNRVTDENQSTDINSSKNVDGNNTSNELNVFYDTPNGSLGNIVDESYATSATNIDKTNSIDENEILNSGENINRDENIITTIDSNTQNTTDTDTTSNTANTTNVNTDEDVSISIKESDVNKTDNLKSSKTNETNIISENGFQVPLSELLIKYRETFLNIDKMIIEDLKNLFMLIY